MRVQKLLVAATALSLACSACQPESPQQQAEPREKTAFQTSTNWMPEIDVQADVAIVYGTLDRENLSFEQRLESWRQHGYNTHFMTGMAWGDYHDFYSGTWDDTEHADIAQLEADGSPIMHGEGSPYVVPDSSFVNYMKEAVVKKVIDAGVSTIYLEEPEFWARAGYSEHFKKAWEKYYGFPWKAQHESIENSYLSNKLKYHLFYSAIQEVSEYAKEYGKSKGMAVQVFIPTHSLINYSAWEIVSPEASLASLPSIDGYIAQVWTGTSRTPNYFNGLKSERVFETAFLEYGCMISMTAPTQRKVFLLTDPIEDGVRDWADYKKNYEATFTAKLLYPGVANYEVMPWPERIYTRPYKLTNSDEETLIPRFYSTQMQIMINSLNDMPVSDNRLNGTKGIGVLMSNSLMFQRFPIHEGYEDPNFSNFFGQVMPLVKRGVPVEIVHLENLGYAESLMNISVLVMSYSNMKPMEQKSHEQLAQWIKNGGTLLYTSKDEDPYQHVMEWWNSNDQNYERPVDHLFGLLGIAIPASEGFHPIGKGAVYILHNDPKEFVMNENGDSNYLATLQEAYQHATHSAIEYKNYFELERGPYTIAAVMPESTSKSSLVISGPVIDLFDPELPILDEKLIAPGQQSYLYRLNSISDKSSPKVLAAATRVYDEVKESNSYSFVAKSPLNTTNCMRIYLPQVPGATSLTDANSAKVPILQADWDDVSGTLLLKFENQPAGVHVKISW